jgi:hypothetical protein
MVRGIWRETALLLKLPFVLLNYSTSLSPHNDNQKKKLPRRIFVPLLNSEWVD